MIRRRQNLSRHGRLNPGAPNTLTQKRDQHQPLVLFKPTLKGDAPGAQAGIIRAGKVACKQIIGQAISGRDGVKLMARKPIKTAGTRRLRETDFFAGRKTFHHARAKAFHRFARAILAFKRASGRRCGGGNKGREAGLDFGLLQRGVFQFVKFPQPADHGRRHWHTAHLAGAMRAEQVDDVFGRHTPALGVKGQARQIVGLTVKNGLGYT